MSQEAGQETTSTGSEGQEATLLQQGSEQAAAPAPEAPSPAPAEAPGEEGESGEAPSPAPAEAPDGGSEFNYEPPEGVKLDEETFGEFKDLAKKHGLNNEAAKELADLGVKMSQKFEAAQAQALQEASDTWKADSKADSEFGGDKLNGSLAVASRALDEFGTPELREMLVASGLGNHPEVIRFFYKVGQTIGEDKMVKGSQQQGATQPLAQRAAQTLYGNKS